MDSYMYYVYVLRSETLDRFYMGYTTNVQRRYDEHLSGKSKYTSKVRDWELLYFEAYKKKECAIEREKKMKQRGNAIQAIRRRLGY